MFKLKEKYEVIRSNLKCHYIRYSLSEISSTLLILKYKTIFPEKTVVLVC